MWFTSDNAGPAHPAVIEALTRANDGYTPGYGAEAAMDRVRARLREIFEAPEAAVYLVSTGTAANALALATLAEPWQRIFCHRTSHAEEDECGAPEFYAGGAKLSHIDGEHGKISAEALRTAIEAVPEGFVHSVQRGPITLTQATEAGGVYALDTLRDLGAVAKEFSLPVHLDGARFANALTALQTSAAEMTWRAGIDAVSFGGTKNGAMAVEAVILFDPERAWEFELRRKRGAHLFSKHRFLSAQMEAYLADDLWLDLARTANARAADLAAGLRAAGLTLLHPVEANMLFFEAPVEVHKALQAKGAQYYLWPAGVTLETAGETCAARLVCNWSTTEAEVATFVEAVKAG
ncbi:MAG: beta-eliminating lyase-related protein [Pseudomonadota bacterium]